MTRAIVFIDMLFIMQTALAQEADIPELNWEPRSDWMNVRDFGATGDGISDDTAALQACFDTARAYGKGAISFLSGEIHKITRTL